MIQHHDYQHGFHTGRSCQTKQGWGQYHSAVKCIQSRVPSCVRSTTACAPQRVDVADLTVLRCMHVLLACNERGCLGRCQAP